MSDKAETAVLAGGCFWIMQQLPRQRDGVIVDPGGMDRRPERQPDRGGQ